MQNLHAYVKIPFDVKPPAAIMADYKEVRQFKGSIADYNDMQLWLKMLGIRLNHVGLFYIPPGKTLPIHIDKDEVSSEQPVKINITYGDDNTVMQWWQLKSDTRDVESIEAGWCDSEGNYSVMYKGVRAEDCDKLYEVNTNRPSLVNVGVFHSAYNPSSIGRWTLCFVLGDLDGTPLEWDKAVKCLANYLDV